MTDAQDLLSRAFEAYNRRDFPTFSAMLHDEVDWPDQIQGGRLVGVEAMRDHWAANDAVIQVEVTPIIFTPRPNGQVEVRVNQVVRSLAGSLWSDLMVRQLYTLRDGLIARMDILPDDAAGSDATA